MIGTYAPILGDTIYKNKGFWYVIAVQQQDEIFTDIITNFHIQLFIIFFAFFALYFIVNIFFLKKFIKPIKELEKGMKNVTDGNLKTKLKIKTGDELEYLSNSFNKMTEELDSSYRNFLSV